MNTQELKIIIPSKNSRVPNFNPGAVLCYDPTMKHMPPPLPAGNGCTVSKINILKSSLFLPYYKTPDELVAAYFCDKDTRQSYQVQGWLSTKQDAYNKVDEKSILRIQNSVKDIRLHHGNHLFLRYPTHWSDLYYYSRTNTGTNNSIQQYWSNHSMSIVDKSDLLVGTGTSASLLQWIKEKRAKINLSANNLPLVNNLTAKIEEGKNGRALLVEDNTGSRSLLVEDNGNGAAVEDHGAEGNGATATDKTSLSVQQIQSLKRAFKSGLLRFLGVETENTDSIMTSGPGAAVVTTASGSPVAANGSPAAASVASSPIATAGSAVSSAGAVVTNSAVVTTNSAAENPTTPPGIVKPLTDSSAAAPSAGAAAIPPSATPDSAVTPTTPSISGSTPGSPPVSTPASPAVSTPTTPPAATSTETPIQSGQQLEAIQSGQQSKGSDQSKESDQESEDEPTDPEIRERRRKEQKYFKWRCDTPEASLSKQIQKQKKKKKPPPQVPLPDYKCNSENAIAEFLIYGDWIQNRKLMAYDSSRMFQSFITSPSSVPVNMEQIVEQQKVEQQVEQKRIENKKKSSEYNKNYEAHLRNAKSVSADPSELQKVLPVGDPVIKKVPAVSDSVTVNNVDNVNKKETTNLRSDSESLPPTIGSDSGRRSKKYGVPISVEFVTAHYKIPVTVSGEHLHRKEHLAKEGADGKKISGPDFLVKFCNFPMMSRELHRANQPFTYLDSFGIRKTKYTSVYIDANGEENVCVDDVDSFSFPYDETRQVLGKVVLICNKVGARVPAVLASSEFSDYFGG